MTRKYNINVTTHKHFICEYWRMLDVQGVCDGFRADKIRVRDCPTREVFKGKAGKILINGKEQ